MKQPAAFILTLLYATYALAGTGMAPPANNEATPFVSCAAITPSATADCEHHLHAGTIQFKKASHHLARAGKMKMPRASASTTTIASVAPAHVRIAAQHFNQPYTTPLHAVTLYIKNCVLLI